MSRGGYTATIGYPTSGYEGDVGEVVGGKDISTFWEEGYDGGGIGETVAAGVGTLDYEDVWGAGLSDCEGFGDGTGLNPDFRKVGSCGAERGAPVGEVGDVLRGEEPDTGGFEFGFLEGGDGMRERSTPADYSYTNGEDAGWGFGDGGLEERLVCVSSCFRGKW
jgi:hypothetical protein